MPSIDKSEILFIINPNSGKKHPQRIIREIKQIDPRISYIITKNTQEVEDLFNSEDVKKYKVVVVAGGDGTVNEVLKYLYNNSNIALAVLPAGSGNGFAKELNFNSDVKSLVEDIMVGERISVDILEINNNRCINVAGLGFDSYVAHKFHKRNKRGLTSYIISIAKSLFIFKPFNAEINTSQNKYKGSFQMITIANTRQFGNNAIISPFSFPNDGTFELILVRPFPFYYYPIFVLRLFLGNLNKSKYVDYIKERESLSIVSDFKKYHVDGDPYSFNGVLNVKMLPNKISLIKRK